MSANHKTPSLLQEIVTVGVGTVLFVLAALLIVVGPDFLLPDALTHAGLG
ncbi:hypothetical protein AA23498_3622 [Acetobacter nitrogenifigens DSM 23921 = NBRC 105050]|uniref:Uncharacterized protein n=1 Tax=Acetobacter nitrogenifigens DSM 23921 = NBRC 105050 TaxID=1120919 RepID=A0A511XF44_9PROT|nr:hypothetical protein [Acetobacter nitrogenifigens]GBR00143.1 hypothetical protein AA23498_3622 [Acetobacter nitrogenifigens DSM 23921 = NBRC 105050]GEN61558.1 hypothetical protein ANI02nite_34420 [Acetobacter nitrogenifigens DSM 23921 = NBRC 105050]